MTDVSEQSVAEVLLRAADLLEKPGAWMRGDLGKDSDGRLVTAEDMSSAVCFCMAGSIWRAAGPYDDVFSMVHDNVFPAVAKVIGRSGIGSWNDAPERTQQEVVAALRSAALLAAPRAGEGVNRG